MYYGCILTWPYPTLLLFTVDVISAIEFNKAGHHLATGDRGGRVVLFERTDAKDVCMLYCKSKGANLWATYMCSDV
jgi:hypothetical protein